MTRARCLAGMVAAAFVGLVCVVLFAHKFPGWVRSSGGDALIVVPIYGIAAILRPRVRPTRLAVGTFALAAVVEFSQLYHAPAIDRFRATFVGRVTIGSTFVPSDFLCYAAGVVFAFAFDTLVARRFHPRRSPF